MDSASKQNEGTATMDDVGTRDAEEFDEQGDESVDDRSDKSDGESDVAVQDRVAENVVDAEDSAIDGDVRPDLLQEVFKIFAKCCGSAGSTRAKVQNGLPQLCSLGDRFPRAFSDVLFRCAKYIMTAVEPRSSSGGTAEVAIELISAVVVRLEESKLAGRLLQHIVEYIGAASGFGPRDKHARHRGAELLWRLASAVHKEELGGGSSDVVAVLLRLGIDKVPVVREAAVPGLSLLESMSALKLLASLAGEDVAPKVRRAAMAHLNREPTHGLASDPYFFRMLADRAQDVSTEVRVRMFASVAAFEAVPAGSMASLLLRGLSDRESSVRRECDCTLHAWLGRQEGDKRQQLLSLLSQLQPGASRIQEAAGELMVKQVFSRLEWETVAQEALQELVATCSELSTENVLLARVALMMDLDAGSTCKALGGSFVLKRVLQALDAGRSFELRQLLWVLLHADSDENSGRVLSHVATAVLLRAPMSDWQSRAPSTVAMPTLQKGHILSVPHLAVALAWHSFAALRNSGRSAVLHSVGRFVECVMVILNALLGTSSSAEPESQEGRASQGNSTVTLEEMGHRFAASAAKAQEAAKRVKECQVSKARFTSSGDFVRARALAEQLTLVESEWQQAECDKEVAASELGKKLLRVLSIIEAVLSQSRADLAQDFSISLLLDDVLRPALMQIDQVPPGVGSVSWPALRVLAVRCIALHALMSADTCLQHWPFFTSVLSRYTAVVIAPSATSSPELVQSGIDIVELCVNFLVDALVTYGDSIVTESENQNASDCHNSGGAQPRAAELFAALAPLLTGMHVLPVSLKRCLAHRICSLLLFGKAAHVPGKSSFPAEVTWALTCLVVETFARQWPSAADTTMSVGHRRTRSLSTDDDVEAVIVRGQLLRFFGIVARLSAWHVSILAAASEGFFSLETWQLGSLAPTPGAPHHSAVVPLPRLARFLAQQFAFAADSAETPACRRRAACFWLESLWRPLALLSLENSATATAVEADLPDALIAAVTGAARGGRGMADAAQLHFVPESMRLDMVAEVAWVVNRVVELWGWNKVGRGSTSGLPTLLLELREHTARFACTTSRTADWSATVREADKRRLQLRKDVADLGINVQGLVHDMSTAFTRGAVNLQARVATSGKGARSSKGKGRGGARKGRGRGVRGGPQLSRTYEHRSSRAEISETQGGQLKRAFDAAAFEDSQVRDTVSRISQSKSRRTNPDDSSQSAPAAFAPGIGVARPHDVGPAVCDMRLGMTYPPALDGWFRQLAEDLNARQCREWQELRDECSLQARRMQEVATKLESATVARLEELMERIRVAAATVVEIGSTERIELADGDSAEELVHNIAGAEIAARVQLALHELEVAAAGI